MARNLHPSSALLKAYPRKRRGVCLENWRKNARLADSYENETTPGETMLTAPLTSKPSGKPKWLAQAGTPLRSLFRAVSGRSALLMALATVTFAAVSLTPSTSFADAGSAPAASAPAASAPDSSAPASSAPSSAPAAAAPAPTPNKGDMAWMMTSTALVLFMSVPALALFYGGLVREKNMLSVLMQVFVGFSLITVLWCVYGYSLAFTEGPNPFIGGLSRLCLLYTSPSPRD